MGEGRVAENTLTVVDVGKAVTGKGVGYVMLIEGVVGYCDVDGEEGAHMTTGLVADQVERAEGLERLSSPAD